MTATIINIPLNKLAAFKGNVRKTQNKGFIAELAASIKAHGLQQNLVVQKDGKKFAVVAGGQRLRALLQLAKAGDIKTLPSRAVQNRQRRLSTPSEISLLENVLRENMHPADEYEAFRDLVDKGIPAVDIAARFGVSKTVVTQRLKLARVSPAVLKAYRAERLTLNRSWPSPSPTTTRRRNMSWKTCDRTTATPNHPRGLTEGEIAASDRRVKFVTLDAYEKAGGATRRDLFSEGENSVFILDPALLDRLVAEKLDAPRSRSRERAGNGRKAVPTSTTADKSAASPHPCGESAAAAETGPRKSGSGEGTRAS